MDGFGNSLSEKFNAEILIRPKSDEEARKLEQLERQSKENDSLMQETRQLNEKCVQALSQAEDAIQRLSEERQAAEDAIAALDRKLDEVMLALREKPEEDNGNKELLAKLEEISSTLSANAQASNEFVHNENVKVYRNVQASIKEELSKNNKIITDAQTEKLKTELEDLEIDTSSGIQTGTLIVAILAFITGLGGIILQVLSILQIVGV
ncbi:MAG: hypothetical protein IJU50_07775 [Lachnospiraceae bacterium]|nr:hypothetical protein [Lachnospiraceae bacterium]